MQNDNRKPEIPTYVGIGLLVLVMVGGGVKWKVEDIQEKKVEEQKILEIQKQNKIANQKILEIQKQNKIANQKLQTAIAITRRWAANLQQEIIEGEEENVFAKYDGPFHENGELIQVSENDPWESPIFVRYSDDLKNLDVLSFGPDRIGGTEDDISIQKEVPPKPEGMVASGIKIFKKWREKE